MSPASSKSLLAAPIFRFTSGSDASKYGDVLPVAEVLEYLGQVEHGEVRTPELAASR